jgi:hypothetical protein
VGTISTIANGAPATHVLRYVGLAAVGTWFCGFGSFFIATFLTDWLDKQDGWQTDVAMAVAAATTVVGTVAYMVDQSSELEEADALYTTFLAVLGFSVLFAVAFGGIRWDQRRREAAHREQ